MKTTALSDAARPHTVRRRWPSALALGAIAAVLGCPGIAPAALAKPLPTSPALRTLTRSPWGVGTWGFAPNVGQAAPGVDFIAQAPGGSVRLAGPWCDIVLAGPKGQRQGVFSPSEDAPRVPDPSVYVVRMHLLDAVAAPEATGENPLPGNANFYLGAHPGRSQVGVPTYEKVRYREVYPGIDLVYYGNPHALEFDFVLAPGADPGLIRLRFGGIEALRIEEDGTLAMPTPVGTVRLKPPRVYQESGGRRQELKGDYALLGPDCVGFAVPDRDAGQALVIDPVLEFSTFFSASGIDRAHRLEVAPDGSIFVLGQTWSSDFPITADGWQTNRTTASCMHFLARFDAQGERLLYSTYVGYGEWAAFALTPAGEPVMTGYVRDPDYPVTPGSISTTNAYGGIGLLKLDTSGRLAFASLIDGPINERGRDVAVDAAGNIYVLATFADSPALAVLSSPLRVYRLEKSKDPRSGLWETVQSGVYGNGGLLILDDRNRTDFDLYRVGVSLPTPFD